jgi:hypothetical protein
MSETTTKAHEPSALRTLSASGIETAGLVPMIQSALIDPSRHRIEHVDCLETRLACDVRRVPES